MIKDITELLQEALGVIASAHLSLEYALDLLSEGEEGGTADLLRVLAGAREDTREAWEIIRAILGDSPATTEIPIHEE